jgi:hypothetical protein
MILRMTMPGSRKRRRWSHSATSRTMSMGARIEAVLAARLVALERLLDKTDADTSELWREYYTVVDLWLRSRAPVTTVPPITRAMTSLLLLPDNGGGPFDKCLPARSLNNEDGPVRLFQRQLFPRDVLHYAIRFPLDPEHVPARAGNAHERAGWHVLKGTGERRGVDGELLDRPIGCDGKAGVLPGEVALDKDAAHDRSGLPFHPLIGSGFRLLLHRRHLTLSETEARPS